MDLVFSFDDGSESIAHYGVLGMRWGKRKHADAYDKVLTPRKEGLLQRLRARRTMNGNDGGDAMMRSLGIGPYSVKNRRKAHVRRENNTYIDRPRKKTYMK